MERKSVIVLAVVLIVLIAGGFLLYNNSNIGSKEIPRGEGAPKLFPASSDLGGFCGFSTKGECQSDTGCGIGGCSRSVCMNSQEAGQGYFTTCEFQECYVAKDYDVNCGCVENECIWN
jgi:eight-cysteine-cluster-containing protein